MSIISLQFCMEPAAEGVGKKVHNDFASFRAFNSRSISAQIFVGRPTSDDMNLRSLEVRRIPLITMLIAPRVTLIFFASSAPVVPLSIIAALIFLPVFVLMHTFLLILYARLDNVKQISDLHG